MVGLRGRYISTDQTKKNATSEGSGLRSNPVKSQWLRSGIPGITVKQQISTVNFSSQGRPLEYPHIKIRETSPIAESEFSSAQKQLDKASRLSDFYHFDGLSARVC